MTRHDLATVHTVASPRNIIRIFISSPGDVAEEREQARRVVASLQRLYPGVTLQPVLWEELALPATASFQESIDFLLHQEPIDIAVFILWSRLGSPLGAATTRPDGTPYRSGTEREFDLMLAAFEQSGRKRPVILAYARQDEEGFHEGLRQHAEDKWGELIRQRNLAREFLREQFHDDGGANLRAYHSYSEPIGFAQRLYAHLRQILNDLVGQRDAAPQWLGAPYRGLEFFDIEHAAIFHGRESETCDVLQRLRDREREGCASVVIIGASGSGKSSLARAGVAATLVQNAFDGGVKEWILVPFLPALGDGPLLPRLLAALAERLPELNDAATQRDDVLAGLAASPELTVKLSIAPAFHKASIRSGGPLRILLLLDQLEELWTGRQITDAERTQFLEVVEALARCSQVSVLATLRSDFYSQAQQSDVFLRLKQDRGHFDLHPPSAAALHRLITEPARMAGVAFEKEEATSQSLDQVILHDASRDPSALPLLEYALDELFRCQEKVSLAVESETGGRTRPQLTFAVYRQLGGVEGALGKRVAETYSRLPTQAQAALPEILPHLVTVAVTGELSAVRRRARLSDLTSTKFRSILTKSLIAARFLVTDRVGSIATVSFAHEALLRRWDTLAAWVGQNRDHLRLRTRIEQSRQRWLDGARHSSLLLSAGLPLEEGRQLLDLPRQLLRAETASYVELSIEHHDEMARRERRVRTTVVASLSMLVLAAVVGGVVARQASRQAGAVLEKNRQVDQENQSLSEANEHVRELLRQAGIDHAEALKNAEAILGKNHEIDQKNLALTEANRQIRELLHRASMDHHVNGKKAWHEFDEAARRGTWAKSVRPMGKWQEAIAHWNRALEVDPSNREACYWLFDTLQRRGNSTEVLTPKILNIAEPVTGAIFSPDGRRVATIHPDPASPRSGLVQVWDVERGETIGKPMHDKGSLFKSVTFSPSGDRLVTGNASAEVQIWDVTTGMPVGNTLRHESVVDSVSFSQDGTRMVTICTRSGVLGVAQVWDIEQGKRIGLPLLHEAKLVAASLSPGGNKLFTSCSNGTTSIRNLLSGTPVGRKSFDQFAESACFSPDGTQIMAICHDGMVRLWDAERGTVNGTLGRYKLRVQTAEFSPDGTRIVTTHHDNSAQMWLARYHSQIGKPLQHDGIVWSASFSPDGTRVVTAGNDMTAQMWDVETGAAIGAPMPHNSQVKAAKFISDGRKITTLCRDNSVRVWDVPADIPSGTMLRHENPVRTASFSPDGTRVVTTSGDRTARIWDVASGAIVGNGLRHEGEVATAEFSLDGRKILTTRWNDQDRSKRSAQLWDAEGGTPIELPLHDEVLVKALLSPEGDQVATASPDGTLWIWDLTLGTRAVGPVRHVAGVESLGFRFDGKMIVATSHNNAHLWSTARGSPIATLRHQDRVTDASFSPDGTQVVTACSDRAARIWNALQGTLIGEPLRHSEAVRSASFSPDGTRIVTVSSDSAQVWDAMRGTPIGEPLRHAKKINMASFSRDGTSIVTASDDGIAQIWDTLPSGRVDDAQRPVADQPDANKRYGDPQRQATAEAHRSPNSQREFLPISPVILRWATARAGLRFRDDGELVPITEKERDQLMTLALPAGPWADLQASLSARGPERRVGCRSDITARQAAERERDFGSVESLRSALQFDPTVPLARMMLANLIESELASPKEPDTATSGGVAIAEIPGEPLLPPIKDSLARAAHFRRYDLDRLPEDADVWDRAAKILRQFPDAQVGIGPRAVWSSEAADQAERRAAEIRAKTAAPN